MSRTVFLGGGLVTALVAATLYGTGRTPQAQNLSTSVAKTPLNPVANRVKSHLDHSAFFTEPIDAEGVTKKCLSCHEEQGADMLESAHFLWPGSDVVRSGETATGKPSLVNTFCFSAGGDDASCGRWHAGYRMSEKGFDFKKAQNIDCLICHDGSGTYAKDEQGAPAPSVNLTRVAASVGAPVRETCGHCHFNGGGGIGVKAGELDDAHLSVSDEVDVHIGRLGLQCVDCHKTRHHQIPGQQVGGQQVGDKAGSSPAETTGVRRVDCSDCHSKTPHEDSQLNKHVTRLACQTCHIPSLARKSGTEAGAPIPVFAWFNGKMQRYLSGDKLTSEEDQAINQPLGSRQDATAKIYPFTLHRTKQLYDPVNKVLIPPLGNGEGAVSATFDWKGAAEKGMKAAELPYSGEYGFIKTHMYWSINHMTVPVKRAVSCTDCHSSEGRMDWKALGYERDPVGGQPHGS